MNIFLACVYVHHVYAWCWIPGKWLHYHVGAENRAQILCKSKEYSKLLSHCSSSQDSVCLKNVKIEILKCLYIHLFTRHGVFEERWCFPFTQWILGIDTHLLLLNHLAGPKILYRTLTHIY